MWRYTSIVPIQVTRKRFEKLLSKGDYQPPYVTDEAITYLNNLCSSYIEAMNRIDSHDHLQSYYETLPEYIKTHTAKSGLRKKDMLNTLLNSIIWDDETKLGVSKEGVTITPWVIADYVYNIKLMRELFNLQKCDKDLSGTIPITVNGHITPIEMTYEQLLGIMVVYRHFHLMHPCTYYGHIFTHEIEVVNKMAFANPATAPGYYNVTIDNHVYSSWSYDFILGLLTGASWNGVDPHTFITEFK